MNIIKEIHDYLAPEITTMNDLIVLSLTAKEELINAISNHLAKSAGKRIRPILTILSAKIFDFKGNETINLAAAIEFIHMATLLHDDVVDESKMRRFLPSANIVWGNKASILVGDFLLSQFFKLVVATDSIPALKVLSDASATIAQGEVSQLAKLKEHRIITEDEYTEIIDAKTAELFASACEVGAIIANQSDEYRALLRQFGIFFGRIFQITDDLLDYFSSSEEVGKNIGDDFVEGKVTLPLIILNYEISDLERHKLHELIKAKKRTNEDFLYIQKLLCKYKIKENILVSMNNLKNSAISSLDQIKINNPSKEYLKSLVEFAINRSY